jgi:amidohydrolase
MRKFLLIGFVIVFNQLSAQELPKNFSVLLSQVEPELINWRHHFHENPELSNREFKTGNYIADFLKSIGLDVKYPVAKTGVVAILKGGKPGPVVGLRADIDALPVTERAPVSFASKVKAEYNGQQVGVMHACGHDAHTAILMATAKVMKQMQKDIPGTIVFFFQPAEEGPPNGEEGGAPLMIKEGAMDNPKIDVMFGLHMASGLPVGQLAYKSGAAQASSDLFKITIHGKGSHGSMPWLGIDPIMISADILQGIQHIVSRQEDLTKAPLVISVGSIHGGVRSNIIPETVEMNGTIRSLDSAMRKDVHERMRKVVQSIAESAGATADIEINTQTLINFNDPALVKKTLPALQKAAGDGNLIESRWVTAAEDFSFYGQKAPTFFFSLGGLPKGKDPKDAGPHHTPDFYLDESGFIVGVKAFCNLVFENAKSK